LPRLAKINTKFYNFQIKSNIMKKMFRRNFTAGIILLTILSLSALAAFNLDIAQLDVSAASTYSSATELWSFTATNHTSYNATPYWSVTTIQDRIYAGESEHYKIPGENNPLIPYYRTVDTIYAFANDGKKLWSFTETALALSAAIDKTVYISGRSMPSGGLNEIFALDAESGDQKWVLSFQGDIHWRTFSDNVMYVGVAHIWTGEGYFIYAVNVTTGQQIWRQTFHWGDDYPEHVIVDNGTIYFAHSRIPTPDGYEGDNEYFAINATDGSTVWKVLLNGSVYGPSALISGSICFSSEGKVYALNATNGAIVWATLPVTDYLFTPTFGSNNDIIYTVGYPKTAATNGTRNVVALNALDGSKLWNYTVSGSQIGGFNGGFYALDPIGNNIYFHVDALSTYALNAITGQQLWRHSGRPSTVNSDVVYWYSGNNLEALDASNGKSLWNCTTTATFVNAVNKVEYFSVGSTIYALNINANSSFEPTSVVSPSPSSNPATPNPSARNNPTSRPSVTNSPGQTSSASPEPITSELPLLLILIIVTIIVVIAVAVLKRKTSGD
jgi:outer membrane protein assembly factor BamB